MSNDFSEGLCPVDTAFAASSYHESNKTSTSTKMRDFKRKVIDSDGWSIVLLAPTDRISVYKLIGILATIFVGFLISFRV